MAENYNPLLDPRVNPLAKPSRDTIKKRFLATPKTVTGSGGITSIDDPTYLGFSLRFDISESGSPLFAGALTSPQKNNELDTSLLDDLTDVAGDTLNKKFKVETSKYRAKIASENESALETKKIESTQNAYGAVRYLNAIGQSQRAEMLNHFVQGLFEINKNRPYYWQSISGLDEAYKKIININDSTEGGDSLISIGTLEALDLKIASLFSHYRNAVYDFKYRRQIIPTNLLYFKVYLDVYEIRNFQTVNTWMNTLNGTDDSFEIFTKNISKLTFEFSKCTWDIAAGAKILENVSNTTPELATNAIAWNWGRVSMFDLFSGGIPSSSSDASSSLKSIIAKQAQSIKANAINATLNAATSRITSAVNSVVLGNVYHGLTPFVQAIRNPGEALSLVNNALSSTQGKASQKGNLNTNIYTKGPSGPQ